MTDLPFFTYTPLSANEIRLLTPVIDDDVIAWTLSTVQLDSQDLKFETLSYVWGSQDESFPIVCNEKLFWVHHNLFVALPYLARRANVDEVLPIWIDAICINQNDEEEKITQIRSMNQIYRRAVRVWIWLGIAEHQDCIPEAISTLSWLKQLYEDPTNCARKRDSSPEMIHLDPSVHKAVTHLVANPWYRRLWIAQELVLSNSAVALCGKYEISIDLLRDAQLPLHRRRVGTDTYLSIDEFNDAWMSSRIFLALPLGRQLSKATSTENIATWLLLVVSCLLYQQYLQPQDRVFGLLGLCDTRNLDIPIESFYSYASIAELYTEFSAFLFVNARYDPVTVSHIWTWLDKASVPGKEGHFPSWVRDLHHSRDTFDRWSVTFYVDNAQRDYKASRQNKFILRGYQHDELKISGHLLDSVFSISLPRPMEPEEFPSLGHIIQWWNDVADWEDNAAHLALSGTKDSLHDFCHTLVGGKSSPDESFDPCQMRRNFRNSIGKWKRLYADLNIEERYGSPLFIALIRKRTNKLTSRLYQVD
jgi:hypothetical protein